MPDLKITEEQGPLRKVYTRAWRFLSEDVWDIELSSLSALRRFGVNAIRVVQLVFRGFREDECPLHASALTFSTLMSIVPVLALSLAMASGLGAKEDARGWVESRLRKFTESFRAASASPESVEQYSGNSVTGASEHESSMDAEDMLFQSSTTATNATLTDDYSDPGDLADKLNNMVGEVFKYIDNISFKALGGAGLCVLLWMTLLVLGRVEASFNTVWGVSVERTLWRKFTDYLSILFIMPILIVATTSLPVVEGISRFLNPDLGIWLQTLLDSKFLKRIIFFLMTSLSFAFILMHMPNTRVKWWPAFTGGVVTAALFIVWLWACTAFQVGVARAGTIYGSFAIVPIVLLWVHMSWQIVFFGAEVVFAIQNCSTFRMEQGARRASVQSKILLALTVITEAGKTMLNGGGPLDLGLFARIRCIPVRFLNEIVDELVSAELLGAINEKDDCYALLKAPSKLKVGEVFDCVLQTGVSGSDLGLISTPPHIERVVEQASEALRSATADMTICDVINYRNT